MGCAVTESGNSVVCLCIKRSTMGRKRHSNVFIMVKLFDLQWMQQVTADWIVLKHDMKQFGTFHSRLSAWMGWEKNMRLGILFVLSKGCNAEDKRVTFAFCRTQML